MERTRRQGRGRSLTALAAAMLLLALSGSAAAATPAPAEEGPCSEGEIALGDLGISSIGCHCSVKDEPDGRRLWRFKAEPVVRGLRENGPAEGLLRSGDRVVAVDGHLITTEAAGERWSGVRPRETVELRVRRGGELEIVQIVAGLRCRAVPAAETGLRAEAPAAPPRAQLPGPPRDRTRRSSILPRGRLGMGLSCNCTVKTGPDGPRWSFHEPPEVGAVVVGGPAFHAGLQEGDVLVAFDGHELTSETGGEAFSSLRPRQRVRLTFRREGEERTVDLVAGDRPER